MNATTRREAELDHVVVVGGGTMGAGIAWACLLAGSRVTLLETDRDAVGRANSNIDPIVQRGIDHGRLSPERAATNAENLLITQDYAQAAGAGLAIVAAFEAMEVKTAIFAALDQVLAPEAVPATNTSYLDIVGGTAASESAGRGRGV